MDLRTLFPLDEDAIYTAVRRHGKCMILTEEQQNNSFAEALAGRIAKNCFTSLDAPVEVLGALDLPAVPMNNLLEQAMLPNPEKVKSVLQKLLSY
jgi:2-oxoisovalerate dehydrogenase E1 component